MDVICVRIILDLWIWCGLNLTHWTCCYFGLFIIKLSHKWYVYHVNLLSNHQTTRTLGLAMLQLFEIVASLATYLYSDIKAKLRISTQALWTVNRTVAHGDGTLPLPASSFMMVKEFLEILCICELFISVNSVLSHIDTMGILATYEDFSWYVDPSGNGNKNTVKTHTLLVKKLWNPQYRYLNPIQKWWYLISTGLGTVAGLSSIKSSIPRK